MAKRKVGFLALLLASVLALSTVFAGCGGCGDKKDPDNPVDLNETKPLVLQTSTMDGVFNPFFSSSAYDQDVWAMVNAGMLIVNPKGEMVAGDEYATIAKSYEVKENADGSVDYEFVIKNGIVFSDGTPLTAEDVLFNYYVLLDPKYDGNTTMYTQPIKGLSEYRNQTTPDKAVEYAALADIAWDLGANLDEDGFNTAIADVESEYELTYADYEAYWGFLEEAGKKFAQDITNYVLANYGAANYVNEYFFPIEKFNEVQKVAYGMIMWGFAGVTTDTYSENENGKFVYLEDEYEAFDESEEYPDGTEFFNMEAYNLAEELTGAYAMYKGKIYAVEVLDRNGIPYEVTYDKVENPSYAERDNYASYKMVATDYDDMGNPQVGDYVKTQSAGYVAYDAEKHEGFTRYDLNTECIIETLAEKQVDVLSADADLTIKDYWDALEAGYTGEDGLVDYAVMSSTEAANIGLEDCLKELFIPKKAQLDGGSKVESISGIVKGKKTIDGVEYETVTITCTKKNPKTILELGLTVAPKHYYTEGFNYTEGAIINAGVEYNNSNFIAHLKTKNSKPMGAGAYVFVSYENNVVEFQRNDKFFLGKAKIKTVRMQVVAGGQEYAAVKAGEVHYATVSATADVVKDVATIDRLTDIKVDNLGYGYICINPAVYKNLNTRIALQTVLDITLVDQYYPNGLAENIYRGMSQVSWAYPEDAEELYHFDETGARAKSYFEAAGYTFENDIMIDPETGDQAIFEFYIPSNASDHPAGKIFQVAKGILDELGAKARVVVDTNLIKNIKTGNVGVYALAWQSALDPDMTQVYSMNSQADSVKANGIKYMTDHAAEYGEDAGKITFNGVEYTQYEALELMTEKIQEGLEYMSPADRKPIYADVLDLLAELVIEIPTYQRKNVFVYDNSVIDANSLSKEITPYWGPMAEIWNVSFVQGK